jgi:hypothetical protein
MSSMLVIIDKIISDTGRCDEHRINNVQHLPPHVRDRAESRTRLGGRARPRRNGGEPVEGIVLFDRVGSSHRKEKGGRPK